MMKLQNPSEGRSASPIELKAQLRRRAAELGFDDCRIAAAQRPRHASEFRSWLENGAAGEMEWMERSAAKRADPENILLGARSVVIVVLNYWQGKSSGPNEQSRGRIARYAWGDDYHRPM